MRIAPLVAAALAAAGLAAPVHAEATQVNTVRVRYGDLDLGSEAGRKALDFRVGKAARQVCRVDEVIVGTRILPKDRRLCYREARRQLDRRLATLAPQGPAGG